VPVSMSERSGSCAGCSIKWISPVVKRRKDVI